MEYRVPFARRVALIGVFSALYVVFSAIPVSQFIGGPAFLTANLLFPALLSLVFPTRDAILIALIGGFVAGYLPTEALFGPLWTLLPLTGVVLGKVAKKVADGHHVLCFVPLVFFSIIAWAYLRVHISFPFWILPHIAAGILCCLLPLIPRGRESLREGIVAFNATMGEQSAMLMIAVYVFCLPTGVFVLAFPLMLIWERLVLGTLGGYLLARAVQRALPRTLL